MNQMLPRDLQETNERRFSKHHINGYIDTAIRENPTSEERVAAGVTLLNEWLDYWTAPLTDQTDSEKYYESKKTRLLQLRPLNIEELVRMIFIGIAYSEKPTLFVSVTAQLASKLGFDDRRDSILTVAEVTAVLCETDAFDITKESPSAPLMIVNRLVLPEQLLKQIRLSMYLPPLVVEPDDLESNYESPYLTHNDCLILGNHNGRTEDICLDVINTQNQTALRLCPDFLSTVEEVPWNLPESNDQLQQWNRFKLESYHIYNMLVTQGNKFYLSNKVDNRLRLYAQGYHVNTQGTAFKKAMVELHHRELVEGVPT